MITGLAYAVLVLSAVGVGWGLLTAVLDKPPGARQLVFAALVELVTVVQSGLALAAVVAGHRPAELATTIGYLVVIVVLIPLAWLWANSERTRYSGVVMAIAALSVLGMTLRLQVLWTAAP